MAEKLIKKPSQKLLVRAVKEVPHHPHKVEIVMNFGEAPELPTDRDEEDYARIRSYVEECRAQKIMPSLRERFWFRPGGANGDDYFQVLEPALLQGGYHPLVQGLIFQGKVDGFKPYSIGIEIRPPAELFYGHFTVEGARLDTLLKRGYHFNEIRLGLDHKNHDGNKHDWTGLVYTPSSGLELTLNLNKAGERLSVTDRREVGEWFRSLKN